MANDRAGAAAANANAAPEPIDVLWINAGLSCDGDTIAMTAATQPSIEDIVRGNLPWIPKVRLLNLFLAYENPAWVERARACRRGGSRIHDRDAGF
jgi:hypothetical protein